MFVTDFFSAFHLSVGDIVLSRFFSVNKQKAFDVLYISSHYMKYVFLALLYLPVYINSIAVSELV